MSELVAREFCDETIALKKTLESGFLVLGERLARIKREQLWEGQWSNFGEFCREMDINEATASRLITVYETYVEKYHIDQADLSGKPWYSLYQLRKMIPANATKQDVEQIVKSTETLNRQELNKMLREQEHGVCQHEWKEVKFRQCSNCNQLERVYEE